MNNVPEQRSQHDDEISLVDLAITFIERRRVFYVVFVIFALGGVAYALLQTEVYQYTSLIQVAEKSSGEYVEAPATIIGTLENRWLPEQETFFRAETDKRLPFTISFSNPENTGLIRFISKAASDDEGMVGRVHENLISSINERQSALVEREKRSIQRRIESVDGAIETLQGGEDTGAAIAEAFERKVGLQSDLEALKGADILVVSRQSADKSSPARTLIVVVATALGGMFGVFFAFFAQFVALVRTQLTEEMTE